MPLATVPYCGACGYPQIGSKNLQNADDVYCNSCGNDITFSGFTGLILPTAFTATAGALKVTFAWTANPDADTTDIQVRVGGSGNFIVTAGVTSPREVVATAGQIVEGSVRSVVNGIPGNWSATRFAVAQAAP